MVRGRGPIDLRCARGIRRGRAAVSGLANQQFEFVTKYMAFLSGNSRIFPAFHGLLIPNAVEEHQAHMVSHSAD